MKKYKNFINENREEDGILELINITDYVINFLKKELHEIQDNIDSDEEVIISSFNSSDNAPSIGNRNDYKEDGKYTHVIIGIKYHYGNSRFTMPFSSLSEMANYLTEAEEAVTDNFEVEMMEQYKDYFIFLIKVDDRIKNGMKSDKPIKKFNI